MIELDDEEAAARVTEEAEVHISNLQNRSFFGPSVRLVDLSFISPEVVR